MAIQQIRDWFQRILPNSQTVALMTLLVIGTLAVVTLADMLLPVFAAIVLAYLLEGLVAITQRHKLPRTIAVIVVFLLFMFFLLVVALALLPLLYQQSGQLIMQLPSMVGRGQELLMRLPEQYPNYVTQEQVNELMARLRAELIAYGQSMVSASYASLVRLITVVVYLILVPMLVFFFLKDKEIILHWFSQYLPRERHLAERVWKDVDIQIGNYVRGKFIEVIILFSVSFLTFSLMGLNYALLLAVFMGLSVIIPYVGATLVTFPVIIVALFQWGVNDQFWYLLTAYAIIQGLDGVLLVPLLFSEVVNLHPVAIIVAILFFGGMWGFWGVFFAIPLATLVQAVLSAWPRLNQSDLVS